MPVAVNVTEMEHRVACLDGKPFALWFLATDRPFALLAGGDSYYRFKMKVTDSSGREFDSADLVESLHLTNGDAHLPKGLCRVDFDRAAKKNYDWITLDLYGTSGFFFLNPDKCWVAVF